MSKSSDTNAPLMLSVSGMRGIVNQSLTAERVTQFARAFGSFIIDQHAAEAAHDESARKTRVSTPTIVLGRDSRPSGEMFADAAAQGLMSVGCNVVRLGIVATPTVAVMVTHLNAQGGIVITASHNPGEWNGVKTIGPAGAAPPKSDADEIILRYRNQREPDTVSPRAAAQLHDASANDIHLKRVLAAADPEPIRARKFKVVLDSVNGAGGPAGRALLEALGCEVIHLNADPTGNFTHPPEPTEQNLADLAKQTSAHHADIGFAQDPDADRLAIIDETGSYIGEEYTLALAAWQVLDSSGSGMGVSPLSLVANLSTSRMIDDIAAGLGPWALGTGAQTEHQGPGPNAQGLVIRTPVGEANVVAAMQAHNAVLGGEGNGGVILPGVCLTRDSLTAMALILALMAKHKEPLSEIIAHVPRYVMIKQKFDLPPGDSAQTLQRALDATRSHFATIPGTRINTDDGLRIDLEDAWIHLRGSNTEPIVRLIAEAKTADRATAIVEEAARVARLGPR